MKRAVLILLGVVTLLLGLLLAAAGGALATLLGQDEAISTQPARMTGTGVALVAEHIRVDESSVPIPEGVGTLTLSVTAPDGRPMFAGTAQPEALDDYLSGAPYDVVVDLASGGRATTRPVPGTQQPARPEGQSFWLASSSGTTAQISSSLDPGTALVVMNADATPGVDADVIVTYRVPGAWPAAWICVGAGVLLVLLSVLFFWRARVARRRRDERRAAEAAALAATVPIAAVTVLPSGAEAVAAPDVPAWAAAPAALSGDELAGPPTGGLVVERSPDGAEAVVSSAAAPSAAPAPPDAGWYPGAAPGAAVVALTDEVGQPASAPDVAPEADDAGPGAPSVDDGEHAGAAVQDPPASAPSAADDAVDTWHDETRPVPVVDPAPPLGAPVAEAADAASRDEVVYDELSAWFREDPGAGGSNGGGTAAPG